MKRFYSIILFSALILWVGHQANAQSRLGTMLSKSSKGKTIQMVVAPNGDDQNLGDMAGPLRTFYEARERVRELLVDERGPDIEVLIQPGFYRLDSTLTFEPMDCSPNRKVTWQTPLGKRANLSGGTQVLGWEPLKDGIWRAPCKLPAFRQIYVNGQRRQRARAALPTDLQTLNQPGDSIVGYRSRLLGLSRIQTKCLELHFTNASSYSIMPISKLVMDSTGEKQLLINTKWYNLLHRKEGGVLNMPTHLEGSLALLDQPGEWFHDQEEEMLYYYPFGSEELTMADVSVPVLTTIMRIQGTEIEPVTNLKFMGLSFTEGNWAGPQNKPMLGVFANMMLDTAGMPEVIDSLYLGPRYGEYQESPSHVELSHCQGVTLFGCLFARMGSQGLKLGEGCKNNLVEYSLFEDISGNGMQVGGTDRMAHHPSDSRFVVANNTVRNCLFRRNGVDYDGAVGLLTTYTEGTVIELNEFTQLPYSAIALGWGWGRVDSGGMGKQTRVFQQASTAKNNIIRGNHIHHVMLNHADGGAIYTMGGQPGSKIVDNMLYQISQGYDIMLGPGTSGLQVGINKGASGSKAYPTIGRNIMSAAREGTVKVVQPPNVP